MVPMRQTSGLGEASKSATADAERRPPTRIAENASMWEPGGDEEEAMLLAAAEEDERPTGQNAQQRRMISTERSDQAQKDGAMSDGIMTALAKLREQV